jgi:hypothetical protein
MSRKILIGALAVIFGFLAVYAQNETQPFSKLPRGEQQSLTRRLSEYVKVYRSRNWKALYDLVSDTGKGSVNRDTFIAAMKEEHGTEYAGMPDLLEFSPDRTEENEDGIDIYGCGKARREHEIYTGIAVVHAVHEHNSWFFTGWTFTQFPNEPCKLLSDPDWKPARSMEWKKPMEELKNTTASK